MNYDDALSQIRQLYIAQQAMVEERLVQHANKVFGRPATREEIIAHARKEVTPNKILIKWDGKVIIVICPPVFIST